MAPDTVVSASRRLLGIDKLYKVRAGWVWWASLVTPWDHTRMK